MLIKPWTFLLSCCSRRGVKNVGEDLLPPPQAIITLPVWYGPDTKRCPDTAYFQNEVRGRSGAYHRRSNHLLIRSGGQVARLVWATGAD